MNNEPDRQELRERAPYTFELDRREFLEVAGFLIVLGAAPLPGQDARPVARLETHPDGGVTVFSGKVEVGQGAATELAMAVAEELRLPLEKVRVVLGDTDLCPNDGITAGSRTTPSTVVATRRAAAERRGGEVTSPGSWRVLGTAHGRLDGVAVVTGSHQFPSDIRRPGMLYGAVLRPPSQGAALASVDKTAAAAMPGVHVVHDNHFAACAAPSCFAARKAIEALGRTARWEEKAQPPVAQLYTMLKETGKPGRDQSRGSFHEAIGGAAKRLSGVYRTAYIQHAPMEPRAAVAEWVDGKLTVWTGTQNPFGVRGQLQQAFHLPPEKVRVIEPGSGGGFGGKHTGEVAIEAARLAKEAGKPVCLRWTRAEEFEWAYARPAGLFEVEAGLDAGGRLVAWDFATYNAGTAAIDTPYRVANARTRYFECQSPRRGGSYRGIAATTNNFARECFMDELAALAGQDALEFRLANLENTRLRDVLRAVATSFRWHDRRKSRGKGAGLGIACGTEKGSYVAACVEVGGDGRSGFAIRDFHMAFECGAILNPSNLRAQVEGSIIQGLGGALWESLFYENGRLTNGKFSAYRVPRFRDVPPLTITLVDRKDLAPAGAGETPIIAVAPAIANACFHRTGERLRAMPLA